MSILNFKDISRSKLHIIYKKRLYNYIKEKEANDKFYKLMNYDSIWSFKLSCDGIICPKINKDNEHEYKEIIKKLPKSKCKYLVVDYVSIRTGKYTRIDIPCCTFHMDENIKVNKYNWNYYGNKI